MKVVYILTKNGHLITRAFSKEVNAQRDCREKNIKSTSDNYNYLRVFIADT